MKEDNKVIKICSCGKALTIEDVKYIGKMEHLHLFNCKHCGSTLSIKGIK